jgi:hypothetical protein
VFSIAGWLGWLETTRSAADMREGYTCPKYQDEMRIIGFID